MKNKSELCENDAIAGGILIPATVTARIANCSRSTVKKVRRGCIGKSGRGKKCQRVVLADKLLRDAIAIGVSQVAREINKNN